MSARIENIASELFSAKGADVKICAFMSSVGTLALHAYAHGSDKEQWSGKGTAARPLRGPWAIAFGATPNDKGDMVMGKAPQTAMAKAFRAVAQLVSATIAAKGRDRTEDGVMAFEAVLMSTAHAIISPSRQAKETDSAAAEAKTLARALEIIKSGAARLTETDADALRAALATFDSLRAAKAEAAPAKAKAKAEAAPAKAATALAQALAAADAVTA